MYVQGKTGMNERRIRGEREVNSVECYLQAREGTARSRFMLPDGGVRSDSNNRAAPCRLPPNPRLRVLPDIAISLMFRSTQG